MSLYLYNTLTRKKELFIPISESSVSLYSCGPTVYGMILIRFHVHLIKQPLQTQQESSTPVLNEVSADYRTLRCNQKYFV